MFGKLRIPDLSYRQQNVAELGNILFVVLLRLVCFFSGACIIYFVFSGDPRSFELMSFRGDALMPFLAGKAALLTGGTATIMLANRILNFNDVLDWSLLGRKLWLKILLSICAVAGFGISLGIPGLLIAFLPSTNKFYSIKAFLRKKKPTQTEKATR